MTAPIRSEAPASRPVDPAARTAELKRLAHELEGVFIAQLFQAMRASVPKDGLLAPSPGEETFTAMLDETLAAEAARRMNHGIGEALYRQLARRAGAGEDTP